MLALAILAAGAVLAGPAPASPDDVTGTTNAGDNLRTGWYPEEASLTPALVKGNTFGRLWTADVEGQVYAQPLLAAGTLVVATEQNHVYGLDPKTGAQKWSKDLGTPWNPADIGCGDLTPSIGVTSTPVFDPSNDTVYMTHKTYASGTSGPARWYMDAVNVETGLEQPGFPVLLGGAAQNHPGVTFAPTTELQRPGLLLLNGVVYAAFGGHCDIQPWRGWIFGVSAQTAQVTTRWVDNETDEGAGIWQSGAGITSDGPDSILVSTGNGGAPTTPTPGGTPLANYGESIIRLQVQPNGELEAVDFFAPFDAQQLDENDADFASGGVTGLPEEYFGTPALPHLAVAVGKEGYVYLLDRDDLGGYRQGSGSGDDVVQRLGPYGGVWSRPAVWPGDGGYVYIPTSSGAPGGGTFDVYKYGLTATGKPSLARVATAEDVFGWGSGAPVVTSDGITSGSAIVWLTRATDRTGANGQLRAYEALPVNGKLVEIFNAPIGTASNYSVPGMGAGRIYVGNREGKVIAFGSPATPVLTGSAASFPTTTIGQSSERTVTLTATESLTLTELRSNSDEFEVGSPSAALPKQMVAGQTISVPVTFSPTHSGLANATLTASTAAGTTASVPLSGTGQTAAAELTVAPPVLSFGGTAVGSQLTESVTFQNTGGEPLTIEGVASPAAPFAVAGAAPTVGSTIAGGDSLTVTLEFRPTETGAFEDHFGLETSAGDRTVPLTGTAGSPGLLRITGESIDYGEVPVGTTATESFTVENIGGTDVTINKSKPPIGGDFTATTLLQEGETIKPGGTVVETVAFSPSGLGPRTGVWAINGNDTTGLHEVHFGGVGSEPATLRITNSVSAPSGSPQASTKVAVSGSCPGGIMAGPLGDGEPTTVALPGAASGESCAIAETAPAADGGSWEVVAAIDGGAPLTLAERAGSFAIPAFILRSGVNTVDLRNAWTPPPGAPATSGSAAGSPSPSPPPTATHRKAKHRRRHRHRRHKHRRRHHHPRHAAAHRHRAGNKTGAGG
ncbi:MAG TPA: choice-of-anchor D domain-containing protein [Solirubrobacterales bacterium]|jgi:iron transport multicopper oxidase|nr:choice-of-anchor D domain-containing protein [Solirubrobacterales bacterium]